MCIVTNSRETVFYLEIARHFGGECLCKLDNGMMQVYGGCVLEQLGLLHHSIDNVRMAMAARNCDDTPKAIEVSLPMLVIQILHLPLHNVELLTQLKTNSSVTESTNFHSVTVSSFTYRIRLHGGGCTCTARVLGTISLSRNLHGKASKPLYENTRKIYPPTEMVTLQ